jgi:type II secretory pathway component PulM
MRRWYASLNSREQKLLVLGAIASAAALAYALILEPLQAREAQLRSAVRELDALNQWMQRAARQAETLTAAVSGEAAPPPEQSLLSVIETTADAAGIGKKLAHLSPESTQRAKLEFKRVPFDPMVTWLVQLNRERGVRISSMSVTPVEPGVVNANVILTSERQKTSSPTRAVSGR